MDGTVVGLDFKAVIEILKLYDEYSLEMFELMQFCWDVEQKIIRKSKNEYPISNSGNRNSS